MEGLEVIGRWGDVRRVERYCAMNILLNLKMASFSVRVVFIVSNYYQFYQLN